MAKNAQEVSNVGGNLVIRGRGGSELAATLNRNERWTLISASPSVITIRPDPKGRSKLWVGKDALNSRWVQFANGRLGYALDQKIPVTNVEENRDGAVLVYLGFPLRRDPLKASAAPKEAPEPKASAAPLADVKVSLALAVRTLNDAKRDMGEDFELKIKNDGTLSASIRSNIE